MKGAMEATVSLVTIYNVEPLWTLVVALMLFRLNPSPANRNQISSHDVVAIIQQQKFVFGFEHEDFTGALLRKSMAS